MKNVTLVRAAAVVVCFVFAGGWAAGCIAAKAPTTTPEPPKHPAAVPPGRTTPPAPAPPGRAAPAPAVQASDPVGALVAAAAAVATSTPAPPDGRPTAPAPLVGPVTRAALEDYETWKTLRAQDYTPDAAAVRTIAQRAKDVRVLAIVATWCPDSRREVPRFFKVYDEAGLGMETVTMVAVDRSKKDAEGLTVKHDILRVPTFVFFRGDQEIGRVVERAVTTLENDIAAILAK